MPLLKTVDILISHGSLDVLIRGEESAKEFTPALMSQLRLECKGCCDVHRLVASVGVALGLLMSDQEDVVHQDVLPFLMIMLAHRYPRVRRWTAEQLYVRLLEDQSVISASASINEEKGCAFDQAMQLLLEVAWDDDLEHPGNVRESRNRVADLIHVPLSDKQREGKRKTKFKKTNVIDEFESYASLVDAAGR